MSKGEKAGTFLCKISKEIVNIIATIMVLLLLLYSVFSVWDIRQVHLIASSANYTPFRPTEEDALSFEELQAINPEVFAWLTVFGTNIDYPIVQGDEHDNLKYVNTNVFLEHSPSGAIFMDWKNALDFSDFKSVFYGHDMENDVKFGELRHYHDFEFFDARRYGTLFFDGQTKGLEFFAFLHTNAYDTKTFNVAVYEPDDKQIHLNNLLELSIHIREDVDVTIEDRLLLLSTCSDLTTHGRDVLIARITDEVPDNPFYIEDTDNRIMATVGELPGVWTRLPMIMRIMLVALPLLLIALMCVLIIKKKSKKQKAILGIIFRDLAKEMN
ncbi:MAG: class B sortase [Lachnospiraceae bacterium]|nr:class B sortase [Lachnospiraceae bacterium]